MPAPQRMGTMCQGYRCPEWKRRVCAVAFDMFDVSGSGCVGEDDLVAILSKGAGGSMSPQQLQTVRSAVHPCTTNTLCCTAICIRSLSNDKGSLKCICTMQGATLSKRRHQAALVALKRRRECVGGAQHHFGVRSRWRWAAGPARVQPPRLARRSRRLHPAMRATCRACV